MNVPTKFEVRSFTRSRQLIMAIPRYATLRAVKMQNAKLYFIIMGQSVTGSLAVSHEARDQYPQMVDECGRGHQRDSVETATDKKISK